MRTYGRSLRAGVGRGDGSSRHRGEGPERQLQGASNEARCMTVTPAAATPNTPGTRRDQPSLESMPVCALICCFLPADSVIVLAQCSRSLNKAARSDAVWAPRVAMLVEDNGDVRVDMEFLPTMLCVERFRHLRSNFPVWRSLQAVERFEGLQYASLRELGSVVKPGCADANFVPFEGLTLPITAQAALELLRCFRAQKGKGKPCIYKKAALLLGRASLQRTLRVAEGTFDKHNKKTRTREPLGNYLLSLWPAPAPASANLGASVSSSSAGASSFVVVKAVGKTSEQRAVERLVVRETARHAKTKCERDCAREGWAKSRAECDELQVQACEAGRLSKLVARLQRELEGKIDVNEQRVLQADVLAADRKLRASLRQQEDVNAKSSRLLEQYKRQAAAAARMQEEIAQERVEAAESKKAAAKMLHKAASLRSSASALEAEMRATSAEAEVERLQHLVASLKAARNTVESAARTREAELMHVCDSESARADAAQREAAAFQARLECNDLEMAALQRDLSHAFGAMQTARQLAETEKAAAVAEAQKTAECAAEKKVAALKDDMVRAAVLDPKNLSPTAERIRAASLGALKPGDSIRSQRIQMGKHGVTRRGGWCTVTAGMEARLNADQLGSQQLSKRVKLFHKDLACRAGGEKHAATFLAAHAKKMPALYKQIGLKLQRKLTVEQTAAMCNETSGMLGAAIRRHLTACGVNLATKADVHSYFKKSWERYETGMVSVPDPKRSSRLITGAWLRVINLTEVMERMMARFHDNGKLAWRSNIPSEECWFQLIIDKGSSATKLVLKYCCIDMPDSVRNVSLVGILDRVKDAYDMMSAFRTIFDQVNDINSRGRCIWTPWRQVLPKGIKAAAAGGRPMYEWQQDETVSAPPADIPSPLPDMCAPCVPDCVPCGRWGPRGCASKIRRSHYSCGNGKQESIEQFADGPALKDCTWSSTCTECMADPAGELEACRRQWAKAHNRAGGWRRMRIFLGGDWLSISVPLGLGGPKNKQFCMVCLASLHDTNKAGTPHLPHCPADIVDPRAPHHAQPALRAGTASIRRQAKAYQQAVREHAEGKLSRKPEPAAFDSCVEEPLAWAGGHMLDFISTTPLHYMLGLTVELINALEFELQQLDAQLSRTPQDEKLAEELQQLSAASDNAVLELQKWEAEEQHHRNSLHVIEETDGAEEAIARGKQRANRARGSPPLPLEEEYRAHLRKFHAASKQVEKARVIIDTVWRKVVKTSAEEPGPFAQSFLDAMDSFKFQRQAYHSGALVGNDCERVLQPEVARALSSLLRPRLVLTELLADAYDKDDARAPYVIMGDNARADEYRALLEDFGILASLFMRNTPVCPHEIARFEKSVISYATRYAQMFPLKEPPPKMHGLCYHMAQQMRRLGGTGFLSESVVESMHVVDNRMMARYACVKNLEEQLQCRARAIWQLCNPNAVNIREQDNQIASRKRAKSAAVHRTGRFM